MNRAGKVTAAIEIVEAVRSALERTTSERKEAGWDSEALAFEMSRLLGLVLRAEDRTPAQMEEMIAVAKWLQGREKAGYRWPQMAVLYPEHHIGERVVAACARLGIPVDVARANRNRITVARSAVRLMTMHTAKGLEFPCVAVAGLGALGRHGSGRRCAAGLRGHHARHARGVSHLLAHVGGGGAAGGVAKSKARRILRFRRASR